jgi:hypothetical protein
LEDWLRLEGDKEGVMRPVLVNAGGRCAWLSLLLTECLILGLLGLGAVGGHAAPPSSLAGETFTSDMVRGSTLTGTCIGSGVNPSKGSFDFSVSGTAAGPFPGTFTESGSFTTSPSGIVNDFSSTFTITSPAGTVTGSKRLAETDSTARCSLVDGGVFVTTARIPTTYTATINGAQRDTGTATVSVAGALGTPPPPPTFSESFNSSEVVELTSKEQCKNEGWQGFGFKTQGDCVSFVATGGKNPPTGP